MKASFIWSILFWVLLVWTIYSLSTSYNKSEFKPKIIVNDTILGGMHYVTWKEAHSGDIYVINVTMDSIKLKMFKGQIK